MFSHAALHSEKLFSCHTDGVPTARYKNSFYKRGAPKENQREPTSLHGIEGCLMAYTFNPVHPPALQSLLHHATIIIMQPDLKAWMVLLQHSLLQLSI